MSGKTPLVIAKDHPELAPIAAAFDEAKHIASKKVDELKTQMETVIEEFNTTKKLNWDKATVILKAENKIENDDTPMSYADGVFYKEDPNAEDSESPIAGLLARALIGKL